MPNEVEPIFIDKRTFSDARVQFVQTVSIVRLKNFARDLPSNSAFREVLLSENDELSIFDFLAKVRTWMTLARCEERTLRGGHGA